MLRYAGIAIVFFALFVSVNTNAEATTQLPNAAVRFDNMTANSVDHSGMICYEPNGTESSTVITLNLPNSSPVTFTNNDTTATNWKTNTNNLPATLFGVSVQALTITSGEATTATANALSFTYASLTSGKMNCFNFTDNANSGISIPSGATNNITGSIATSPSGNTVNYATATISNSSIAVTATVGPQFSFSLSGNTVALGSINLLTAGTDPTVATSGNIITGTVSTNAANGWESWIDSANGKLSSVTSGGSIYNGTGATGQAYSATSNFFTCSHQSAGTCYGMYATGSSNTSVDTAYRNLSEGSGTYAAGTFSTYLVPLAEDTAPASGDTFTMYVMAGALATTPAATDYTDTLNVVAAGNF